MTDRVRDFAESLPPFSDDPVRRLAHTLAALESAPDDRHAVDATTGLADLFGQNWTGLTVGDLRALLRLLDRR